MSAVTDISNRVRLDEVARWRDRAGIVHIVGRHMRGSRLEIFTDCDHLIASIHYKHDHGFYEGDGSPFTTCLACLGRSNFETYRPR